MNKKRIILLSLLLGLAVAMLGLLLLVMVGGGETAVFAQATPAPTDTPRSPGRFPARRRSCADRRQ